MLSCPEYAEKRVYELDGRPRLQGRYRVPTTRMVEVRKIESATPEFVPVPDWQWSDWADIQE